MFTSITLYPVFNFSNYFWIAKVPLDVQRKLTKGIGKEFKYFIKSLIVLSLQGKLLKLLFWFFT
jgi:hypothetical protein